MTRISANVAGGAARPSYVFEGWAKFFQNDFDVYPGEEI